MLFLQRGALYDRSTPKMIRRNTHGLSGAGLFRVRFQNVLHLTYAAKANLLSKIHLKCDSRHQGNSKPYCL